MMDPTFTSLAPGAAAIFVSFGTLIIALVRAHNAEESAARTDARAAAKDTVEILAASNKALLEEVADLHGRVSKMERERKELTMELKASEKNRATLEAQVARLATQLEQATLAIRGELRTNTEISQATLNAVDAADLGRHT